MARTIDTVLTAGLVAGAADNPLTITPTGGVFSVTSDSGLFAPDVGAAWQIANDGTIAAPNAVYGIVLTAPGSITVGASSTAAKVSAAVVGIDLGDPADVLANFGTIVTPGAEGVLLTGGGAVTNGSATNATAFICGGNGIFASAGSATLANQGIVVATTQYAVYFAQGGSVSNGTASQAGGSISGVYSGVYVSGGVGNVANYGTITATGLAGVLLDNPGTVANGSASNVSASISGQTTGIFWTSGSATILNDGTISASGSFGVVGVGGGTIVNGATNDTTATISSPNDAVFLFGGAATIANYGTIASTQAFGIVTTGPTTLTNFNTIAGAQIGVVTAATGTIANSGSIVGTSSTGAWLEGGGTITNGGAGFATPQISGGVEGVLITGPSGTVINYGTIAGAVGVYETSGSAGATSRVVNAGLIKSTNGASGVALSFSDPGSTLVLQSGASFVGNVLGGSGVLELGAGGGSVSGIGSQFVNFSAVQIDAGTNWTLAGTDTIAATSGLAVNGTATLASGATVDVESTLSAGTGGSISLGGSGTQLLELGTNASGGKGGSFATPITGVNAGDRIDLIGVAGTGAYTTQVTSNGNGTSTVVVKDAGSATLATLTSVSFAASGLTFAAGTDAANGALQLVANSSGVFAAPLLAAALANDTGASATDGITTDDSIRGSVSAPNGLKSITVSLDGGAAKNASGFVQGGSLSLTNLQVSALAAGGTLNEGPHTLSFTATDNANVVSNVSVAFTFDAAVFLFDSNNRAYSTGTGNVSIVGGTGDNVAAVRSLTAQLDGGAEKAVTVAANNSFTIDVGGTFGTVLSVGTHDVTVIATSVGGQSTSEHVIVTVTASGQSAIVSDTASVTPGAVYTAQPSFAAAPATASLPAAALPSVDAAVVSATASMTPAMPAPVGALSATDIGSQAAGSVASLIDPSSLPAAAVMTQPTLGV